MDNDPVETNSENSIDPMDDNDDNSNSSVNVELPSRRPKEKRPGAKPFKDLYAIYDPANGLTIAEQ